MSVINIPETLRHSIQITGFVMVMMLVIDYANVRTQGAWQKRLSQHSWGQCILAAFLGAIPGCLGAFAVVALYSHRNISLGALVAAMLATAGDESFVMFAMIPKQALVLHSALFAFGVATGILVDRLLGRRMTSRLLMCRGFVVHDEHAEELHPPDGLQRCWRHCSASRGALTLALALLLFGTITGKIGPSEWNWVRITILLGTLVAILIVATVSEHFLEEHLWNHVALRHVPRVFVWTLGALLVTDLLTDHLELGSINQQGLWLALVIACLVGLIPESGPHLVFVTLYAQGLIPISILVANSIIQDGHGMLPLLAHSRRAFVVVKGINLVVGLGLGTAMLALGH